MDHFDGSGEFSLWIHSHKLQLNRFKVAHHIKIDDSTGIVIDGEDEEKKKKKRQSENREAVHLYLDLNLSGDAKKRVMGDEFIGKPYSVIKKLEKHYDPTRKPGEEQRLFALLDNCRIGTNENLPSLDFRLQNLMDDYVKAGGTLTEKDRL